MPDFGSASLMSDDDLSNSSTRCPILDGPGECVHVRELLAEGASGIFGGPSNPSGCCSGTTGPSQCVQVLRQ